MIFLQSIFSETAALCILEEAFIKSMPGDSFLRDWPDEFLSGLTIKTSL